MKGLKQSSDVAVLLLLLFRLTVAWTQRSVGSCTDRLSAPPSFERQKRSVLFATSSSKLKKKDGESSTSKGSVIERLSQAAAQAKQTVENSKKNEQKIQETSPQGRSVIARSRNTDKSKSSPTKEESETLGSLQSLTAAIEAKLEKNRRQSFHNQNRDAMSQILRHNQEVRPGNATVREVAVLLTKPLQNDRITLEHANRVRCFVRSMIVDDYRPDVICFVGPQSPGNLVADADASYLFFLELCEAQNIPTHGIDIHLVKGSVGEGALEQIAFFLKETCSPVWTMELPKENGVRQRLHVHFTLVSSEYELCQLNDIHDRSPGRSPLRTLTTWSSRSFETTWTYLYTTTILPAEESGDVGRMFRAKTFKNAQELIPVLQHMKGVAENREFFQGEAYRVLVAARRSIVKDMELLYHRRKPQPSPRQSTPTTTASHVTSGRQSRHLRHNPAPPLQQQSIEVVLEAALLSLGRCLDLVRPAGRGTGLVPSSEWKLAASLLEKAIGQIVRVCDTDRPIEPFEWGQLGENTDCVSNDPRV